MYVSTLECSWLLSNSLERASQSRWFGTSITLSPSLLEELGMV